MSTFLIGEYVERIFDDAIGIVQEIQPYKNDVCYRVELIHRGGTREDNMWVGTPSAWRRHHRVHAHIATWSRDCDGEYTSGRTEGLISTERCESHGDLSFKQRVIGSVVSVYAEDGTLTVMPDKVEWHETTDEGYSAATIRWCEDDCTNDKAWSRDHSAEKAAY